MSSRRGRVQKKLRNTIKAADSSRALMPPCSACGAAWRRVGGRFEQEPHRADCVRVAEERAHVAAVKAAWSGAPKSEAPKPDLVPSPDEDETLAMRRLAEARARLVEAVPEWIAFWLADPWWTHDKVIEQGRICGDILAHPGGGDVLQFGSQRRRPAEREEQEEDAFNALVTCVAALSFAPGGVGLDSKRFMVPGDSLVPPDGPVWKSDPARLGRGAA